MRQLRRRVLRPRLVHRARRGQLPRVLDTAFECTAMANPDACADMFASSGECPASEGCVMADYPCVCDGAGACSSMPDPDDYCAGLFDQNGDCADGEGCTMDDLGR